MEGDQLSPLADCPDSPESHISSDNNISVNDIIANNTALNNGTKRKLHSPDDTDGDALSPRKQHHGNNTNNNDVTFVLIDEDGGGGDDLTNDVVDSDDISEVGLFDDDLC